MRDRLLLSIITCLVILFSAGLVNASEYNLIRAKIGIEIKSGDRIYSAKTKNRLQADDLFRIYVKTQENYIIYIVHSDDKSVTLLNMTDQKVHGSTIILPSNHTYYQPDGISSYEKIAIICSPDKIEDLQSILSDGISPEDWDLLVSSLKKESSLIEPTVDEKPFTIAGNVRSLTNPRSDDAYVDKLQIYSGKGLLIKNYEFRFKK